MLTPINSTGRQFMCCVRNHVDVTIHNAVVVAICSEVRLVEIIFPDIIVHIAVVVVRIAVAGLVRKVSAEIMT